MVNSLRKKGLKDPAHPGELIRETIEALREETGEELTVKEIAEGLTTTRKTLSATINGKQSITPEMAIKLSASFRNTTAEFWLRAQDNFDLAQARKKVNTKRIKVFWRPAAAL
jgi:addiction module HigA family antidote